MFKRRVPLSSLQTIREFMWPSMGWKRFLLFLKYRILRLSDSTHRIARGLACGSAISFSPLVGSHFIQAGIIAYAIRGNLLASLIGTFVGNPWTFPIMWYFGYVMGIWVFGVFGIENLGDMPDHLTFAIMWEMIQTEPLKLFVPWMVGGYILAFLSWPIYFVLFFYLVKAGKQARAIARQKRLERKMKKQFCKAEHSS